MHLLDVENNKTIFFENDDMACLVVASGCIFLGQLKPQTSTTENVDASSKWKKNLMLCSPILVTENAARHTHKSLTSTNSNGDAQAPLHLNE